MNKFAIVSAFFASIGLGSYVMSDSSAYSAQAPGMGGGFLSRIPYVAPAPAPAPVVIAPAPAPAPAPVVDTPAPAPAPLTPAIDTRFNSGASSFQVASRTLHAVVKPSASGWVTIADAGVVSRPVVVPAPAPAPALSLEPAVRSTPLTPVAPAPAPASAPTVYFASASSNAPAPSTPAQPVIYSSGMNSAATRGYADGAVSASAGAPTAGFVRGAF